MDVSLITILNLFYLIYVSFLSVVAGEPYYGMCANPGCSTPIAIGSALLKYMPIDNGRLKLHEKDEFEIYVKHYGEKKNLFGILLKGEKGYVPNNFVKETRSIIKDLVPAQVEFIHNQVGNSNWVSSQVHVSISHHEIIDHTSPDTYLNEHNSQSNPQGSNSYSGGSWTGDGSQFHTAPHFHVRSSHVHATVSSEAPSVGQQPSISESTSHKHYNTHNEASSSFGSNVQQSMSNEIPPNQPYHQSMHGNENQSPPVNQFNGELQTSFSSQPQSNAYSNQPQSNAYSPQPQSNAYSPQPQSNVYSQPQTGSYSPQPQNHFPSSQPQSNSYSQISYNHELHTNNPGVSWQNPNEQSDIILPIEVQYDPLVSTQYSQEESIWYPSTGSSYPQASNLPPEIADTISALRAQGLNDDEISKYISSATGSIDPSQNTHARPGFQDMNYRHGYSFPSQSEYSGGRGDETYSSAFPGALPNVGAKPNFNAFVSSEETYVRTWTPINDKAPEQSSKDAVLGRNKVEVVQKEQIQSENVRGLGTTLDSKLAQNLGTSEVSKPEEMVTLKVDETLKTEYSYKENSAVLQEQVQTSRDQTSFVETTSAINNDILPKNEYSHKQDSAVLQEQVQTSSEETSFVQTKPVRNNEILPEKTNINVDKTVSHDSNVNSFIKNSFEKNSRTQETKINSELPSVEETPDDIHSNDDFTFSESNNTSSEEESDDYYDDGDIVIADNDDEEGIKDNDPGIKTGIFSFDSADNVFSRETINETDILLNEEQQLDAILNVSEMSEAEKSGYLNAYQIRNLKGEQNNIDNQNIDTSDEMGENITYAEFDLYLTIENSLEAIRSFIEVLLSWIPEPLYSTLMELQSKGISPRVPVFTALSAVPCLLLIIAVVYIKERSKEKQLIVELALSEKSVYTLSAEKNVLEEKLEKTEAELESSKALLSNEQKFYDNLKAEVRSLNQNLEDTQAELESKLEEIDDLKEREKEYTELISDHEKAHLELMEEKNQLILQLSSQQEITTKLNNQLQEKDKELKELQEEKSQYLKTNEVNEKKLSQLQSDCNQLLKEAEIWNLRLNELNTKLSEESQAKHNLEETLKTKDSDIESLNFLVQSFKTFEELDEDVDEDERKTKKEKLQCLLNSASISICLQNQEDETKLLFDKLSEEKNKIIDLEVELLEAKSEVDKLKLNYNRALQDKTEAQTKLEVLTNYFKDKEIQLQKQLGAQEVFREKREKDADSAERRIMLIEQENASYKSQVASMKQEMEETERNLKSQIAVQEKKAHENWIAARAAERKLEDMKQEVTQLRQKLTLLEREQGGFMNSTRDDVIRPIPQRIAGINDETISSQDTANSIDEPHNMYRVPLPPPLLHPDMPRDRPLPPLPPLPPPPFEPSLFGPPPPMFGHFPREPMFSSEFRVTPPEFARGRASTPPRGRQSAVTDGEMGPRQSSPLGGEMRESRNSTPPHSLPDFHDIPPPPRPFYPPGRFPFRPPFRRDFAQGPRPDYHGDNSSGRGTQPAPVPQDHWPASNSRV